MAADTSPPFFPGYEPVCSHATITIDDSSAASLKGLYAFDLSIVRSQKYDIWASNIRARYQGDPIVMHLMDLLDEKMGVTSAPTEQKPWNEQFPQSLT